MTISERYAPGAAFGAEVKKEGDKWTLVLVRDLRHPPEKVWKALTDPEQLREWARSMPTGTSALSALLGSQPWERRRRM